MKSIIVVEDEKDLRELYVQILSQQGFEVDQAVDGEEGYMKLSKKTYDLVLLDIILPKMDGLQLLEKLKNESKDISKSVVLLTNLSQDIIISKAVAYGVKGYMVKSDLTPPQIIEEVKGHLENKDVKTKI